MSLTPKLLQQGAAGSAKANYIEDVFSAYLYSGSGSTKTITNGIDLSTKGGLVWIKVRNDTLNNILFDTARGDFELISNSTAAQANNSRFFVPLSTGFSLGGGENVTNNTPNTYASWTFRKQPKFFDVVTWTGNGSVPRSIPHELGSVPGFVAIKLTSGSDNWICRHKSLGDTPNDMTNYTPNSRIFLNLTNAAGGSSNIKADATNLTVNHVGDLNASGQTYVAYLFAHDAGGFGLTGNDNVISCGSYTTDGSGTASVTLGWEPQFLLVKRTQGAGQWVLLDTMRGAPVNGVYQGLAPNASTAETGRNFGAFTATGFTVASTGSDTSAVSETYIYIAIRRGPMKVPTTGTEVFSAETYDGNNTLNREFSFSMRYSDLSWFISRNYPSAPVSISFLDRMRGPLPKLWTGGTNAESTSQANVDFANMEKIKIATLGSFSGLNESGTSFVLYNLKRTPRFFDEVCYTGTGSGTQTISHNLGVTPELTINKSRSGTRGWTVYYNNTTFLRLNETNAGASESLLSPTSTTFNADLGAGFGMNAAETYVTYLFASCPGVSKVGSYTGNGSSQTIDCGFAAGARFVLIKRTNATGDWYTFDTARGIIAGNDPFLKINSTAAETTSYDAVDPANSGFIVNNDATNFPINVASATYIFLAIA